MASRTTESSDRRMTVDVGGVHRRLDHLGDDCAHIDSLRLDLQVARLQARDIEELIDDRAGQSAAP